MRRTQQGSALTYFLFIAGAVAVATSVALSNVSSLARTSGDSRATSKAVRTMGLWADTVINLGYAEVSDGRPVMPSVTYPRSNPPLTGGYALPVGLGPAWGATDPWGNSYGFCDFSLWTWSGWNTPLFAILSAGKDKAYQTTCSDVFNGARKGDDLVRVISAADWRLAATNGKTSGYKPPLNLLTDLNTVVPSGPGEVRLVLETKEVYINPQGLSGSSNWQLVTGASTGSTNGKYIKRDARGIRKWSDGTMARRCQDYLVGGSGFNNYSGGYTYTGDIGDGLYWINPSRSGGIPWAMYCDMTSEFAGRSFYTSLTAYWPMDEGPSAPQWAFDYLGNSFALNSTSTGGIVPVGNGGSSPPAKSVTGRNPVNLLALNSTPAPTQVTISAWLDTSTFQPGHMPFGFAYWDAYLQRATANTPTIGLNTASSDLLGATFPDGRHHIVFVFDTYAASQARGYADERVYVDGIRMPLSYFNSYTETAGNRALQSILNIGGWSGDNNTVYWPVNATYSDVVVWTRALTDTEVGLLYRSNNTFGGMLTTQAGYAEINGVWSNVDGSTTATSCMDYFRTGARANGRYLINPSAPYSVFCDQINGGWTLVMKQAAGDGTTLQGDTVYWTQAGNTLNDTPANQNLNDGNFVSQAFSTISATQYRLHAANETTEQFYTASSASTPQYAFSNATLTNYTDTAGVPGNFVNWFVHTSTYPNGNTITAARFGVNFMERPLGAPSTPACGARWGWAANQDAAGPNDGTHDSCGGLGAWGTQYGSAFMNNNKGAWQPATVYLWAR
ncbi:hypothetical protein [Ralstonia pseudosolanacearum]|uniref:hypothetical protein n=1 Tax=Ralstonia pseudosolanacearum TaxID=1310165 RepID=UPI003CE9493C